MPGLLDCTETAESDEPIPMGYFIKDAEMKIYEKQDTSSKYRILPANYLYTDNQKGFLSVDGICDGKPCKGWESISSNSGLEGYVPNDNFFFTKDSYKYHIKIEHNGSKFFISYLGLR